MADKTFDLYIDGQQTFINNRVGTDAMRLFESAHIGRSAAIRHNKPVDVVDTATGEVMAAFAEDGSRRWPPANTDFISRADWVH